MNLTAVSDTDLFDLTVKAIWRAAVGESQGGHDPSYDNAMDLLAESNRRLDAAGHEEYCKSGVYSRAFEQATAEHAYRTPEPQGCTCGADR